MKLSVVIPAYNEALSITETLENLFQRLSEANIPHEILVVNDNSKDNTLEVLENLQKTIPSLVIYTNKGRNGFGYAVRYGLEKFNGDCVAIKIDFYADLLCNEKHFLSCRSNLGIGQDLLVFACRSFALKQCLLHDSCDLI